MHRRRSTGSTGRGRGGARAAESGPVVPPPLFNQVNVRKPEYWQFARLIAPAEELPEGKKAWTAHDAIGIWCMRCNRALNYQMGSSQSIRYHMETKHNGDLSAFRSQLASAKACFGPAHKAVDAVDIDDSTCEVSAILTPVTNGRGTKRKERVAESISAAASDVSTALASDASAQLTASPAPVRSDSSSSTSSLRRQSTNVGLASPPAPRQPSAVVTASLPTARSPVAANARHAASTDDASATSWHRNVQRRSGFWGNAYWYDLNLLRRMPLADRMLDELLAALPPCDGKRVLDLCAGSGRASAALLAAYPTAIVTLVDSSSERLAIAQKRLLGAGAVGNVQFVVQAIELDNAAAAITNAMPVDVVVASLALHVLAEAPVHYAQSSGPHARAHESTDATYERIFRKIFRSLTPGGHVVFADHVGQLGLFAQLQAMARVGFVDVDCAWRQDDSFVAGGRRPLPQ